MSENTAVATVDNISSDIAALNNEGLAGGFSSIEAKTFEERLELLNIITESKPLADHLNKTLAVSNVIIQRAEFTNEVTGEVEIGPRTVIVTETGEAYHAASKGVFLSMKNMIGLAGHPRTWPAPIQLHAVKQGAGNRKYLTIMFRPADA